MTDDNEVDKERRLLIDPIESTDTIPLYHGAIARTPEEIR